MLLKTNEEISVKSRICDWHGHVHCFHFAEQPFCLSVSALTHLNNDVQQHSLACPALCAENHSTRKKTRCSKTTFTSRSAVKWKRILFGLVGLYVTERQHLDWRPCRSTVTCLKTPLFSWIVFENIWNVISSCSTWNLWCLFVFTCEQYNKAGRFFFTSFTQVFFTVLKVWWQKRLSVFDRRWRLGLVRWNPSRQNPLHWLQQGGSSSYTLQGPRGGYCGPAAHPAHQRGEDPRRHLHLQCCQLSLLISLHSQDEVNQIVSSNVRLKQVWYWFSISWC